MGEITDIFFEDIFNWEQRYSEYCDRVNNEYALKGARIKWQTEDGREISVSEMGDMHLYSALDMVREKDPENPWVDIFLREIEKREI